MISNIYIYWWKCWLNSDRYFLWVSLSQPIYGSGHEGGPVLLPGFAIIWWQNQVTRQAHLRDLTHILNIQLAVVSRFRMDRFTDDCCHRNINNHNTNSMKLSYCFPMVIHCHRMAYVFSSEFFGSGSCLRWTRRYSSEWISASSSTTTTWPRAIKLWTKAIGACIAIGNAHLRTMWHP